METKTFINTVFYCGTSAMQVQLTSNGIFIDVAPSAGKNKFDWSKKAGVKLSLAEVSNLLYSLEMLRKAFNVLHKLIKNIWVDIHP